MKHSHPDIKNRASLESSDILVSVLIGYMLHDETEFKEWPSDCCVDKEMELVETNTTMKDTDFTLNHGRIRYYL